MTKYGTFRFTAIHGIDNVRSFKLCFNCIEVIAVNKINVNVNKWILRKSCTLLKNANIFNIILGIFLKREIQFNGFLKIC